MPLAPGDRVSPYEVRSLLGRGGMGEVYRARDMRLLQRDDNPAVPVSTLGRIHALRGDRTAAHRAIAELK